MSLLLQAQGVMRHAILGHFCHPTGSLGPGRRRGCRYNAMPTRRRHSSRVPSQGAAASICLQHGDRVHLRCRWKPHQPVRRAGHLKRATGVVWRIGSRAGWSPRPLSPDLFSAAGGLNCTDHLERKTVETKARGGVVSEVDPETAPGGDLKHKGVRPEKPNPFSMLAPRAGLEPATQWLTATCSTN